MRSWILIPNEKVQPEGQDKQPPQPSEQLGPADAQAVADETRTEKRNSEEKKPKPEQTPATHDLRKRRVVRSVISHRCTLTVTHYLTHKHFANFCRCVFLTLLLFPRSLAEGGGRKSAGGYNSGVQVIIEDPEHQMRCLWNDG